MLGISGGIAAYKAAELARLMVKDGQEVRVVMTPAATQLISPVTMQTLTGNPVAVKMFDPEYSQGKVKHVDLATFPDLVVVAPATANTLSKLSTGLADNLLSTLLLATPAEIVMVPSMNNVMYGHPAVRHNFEILRARGVHLMEAGEGELACSTEGKGRMPEPADINSYIKNILNRKNDYSGIDVLVTAGPTREPLDPVRYIGNRSSGKMGYAVARAFKERGARVCLVSGPTEITPPPGVETIKVETAREMFHQVKERFSEVKIVVKAAAVADFAPVSVESHKIKKHNQLTLALEKNIDILKWLGENKKKQILVGFAAETRDLLENAAHKLHAKNLDLIVANDLTEEGSGFAGETNKVKIIFPGKKIRELPLLSKKEVSHCLLDEISPLIASV